MPVVGWTVPMAEGRLASQAEGRTVPKAEG